MIMMETRKYRWYGITELMGSQPASEKIRSEYIASKAPTAEMADEEQSMLKLEEKGLTIFLRDMTRKNAPLCMLDYQVRAFFKGAFDAMKEQLGIQAIKNKVDKYIFVSPRKITLMRDGEPILDEDYIKERSLRAETPQGPRVALASSETVDTPWYVEFEITMIPNKSTKSSEAISWEAIENAMDYGALQGMGQWRSGGNGRFRWERVDAPEETAEETAEKERRIEERTTAEAKKRGRKPKNAVTEEE